MSDKKAQKVCRWAAALAALTCSHSFYISSDRQRRSRLRLTFKTSGVFSAIFKYNLLLVSVDTNGSIIEKG
jgi:hypothetical protein